MTWKKQQPKIRRLLRACWGINCRFRKHIQTASAAARLRGKRRQDTFPSCFFGSCILQSPRQHCPKGQQDAAAAIPL